MAPIWRCCNRELPWGERTLIMGIVNVTPDSFSDGGNFYDTHKAIEHAYRLIEEGADVIDIGGASSRPGAEVVSEDEELQRVLPVVEEIARQAGYFVSVDTFAYRVAARCVEAGVCIINDITGLQHDSRLASLAAESGAGLVLMHMRGTPQTMQTLTHYTNLLAEIQQFFARQVAIALSEGIRPEQLVLDPGIGFSKTAEQNLEILKHLHRVRFEEYPLLLGVSRKSFIGNVTGSGVHQRMMGTAGAVAVSVLNGANIVRVHDVGAMRDVVAVVDAVNRGTLDR